MLIMVFMLIKSCHVDYSGGSDEVIAVSMNEELVLAEKTKQEKKEPAYDTGSKSLEYSIKQLPLLESVTAVVTSKTTE